MERASTDTEIYLCDNRIAVLVSANPVLLKFNRLGYGIQEIPIFL